MPSADELPLELLITVLSFLHDVRAIAVCACVSRQWRKAAAQAVPRDVILHGFIKEEMSSLLLRKPCVLSTVEVMQVICHPFREPQAQSMIGTLFARICTEATALKAVFM